MRTSKLTRFLVPAATILVLLSTGCSSQQEQPTRTADAESAPALSETQTLQLCSATLEERFFAGGETSFEAEYPQEDASTSIREGEWFVVFTPASTREAVPSYYCASDGEEVVAMNRDEYQATNP